MREKGKEEKEEKREGEEEKEEEKERKEEEAKRKGLWVGDGREWWRWSSEAPATHPTKEIQLKSLQKALSGPPPIRPFLFAYAFPSLGCLINSRQRCKRCAPVLSVLLLSEMAFLRLPMAPLLQIQFTPCRSLFLIIKRSTNFLTKAEKFRLKCINY